LITDVFSTRCLGRLAGLLALALVLGCAGPPPSAPSAPRNLVADAMLAFDQGEWARAADLLRLALAQDPGDAALHYYSAVAATRLDRRDDAIREFRWVVANVAPDLPEAVEARQWLIRAGVLARPAEPLRDSPRGETPSDSGLQGRVVWAGERSTARVQLFLKGAPKSPNAGMQWVLRTDESGGFEFKGIPPGTYMLTDKVAGERTWRLRVRLEPGEVTSLDLSEGNSARVRDDFPES
jgi:tetratricopeptide (TPR) repeat protein